MHAPTHLTLVRAYFFLTSLFSDFLPLYLGKFNRYASRFMFIVPLELTGWDSSASLGERLEQAWRSMAEHRGAAPAGPWQSDDTLQKTQPVNAADAVLDEKTTKNHAK